MLPVQQSAHQNITIIERNKFPGPFLLPRFSSSKFTLFPPTGCNFRFPPRLTLIIFCFPVPVNVARPLVSTVDVVIVDPVYKLYRALEKLAMSIAFKHSTRRRTHHVVVLLLSGWKDVWVGCFWQQCCRRCLTLPLFDVCFCCGWQFWISGIWRDAPPESGFDSIDQHEFHGTEEFLRNGRWVIWVSSLGLGFYWWDQNRMFAFNNSLIFYISG